MLLRESDDHLLEIVQGQIDVLRFGQQETVDVRFGDTLRTKRRACPSGHVQLARALGKYEPCQVDQM